MIDTTLPFGVMMPPTQKDLPSDDGKPMETQRHKMQMDILIETLYPWLEDRSDGYVGGNMFLYFSLAQVRNQDFQGPDFFAVLGVPKGERLSWVVWEEGKAPNVIIELLSPSTAAKDKLVKKLTYQNDVRVPEYFWFDPFNPNDLAGFRLDNGTYQPIFSDSQDRLVSQQLELALVRWQGLYRGVNAIWLRWQTLDGELIPTGQEEAIQAQIKAQEAESKAQAAEIKAQVMESILQQYRDRYGDITNQPP
jgi:Uma2 family endonuclease